MKAASRGTSVTGLVDALLLALALCMVLLFAACKSRNQTAGDAEFVRLMNVGKSLYEKGDAAKAIEAFQKAVTLAPTHPDARLNLANAYLLADQANEAAQEAREILKLEPNSAAAYYIEGCADLRASKFDDAIKALQTAKDIDRTINAVSFQLGRAFQSGGKLEDALQQFDEIITFETNKVSPTYLAAHYNKSQILVRLGRTD